MSFFCKYFFCGFFAADVNRLTPGSMVWARTKSGFYEHGFLSQKDTHFNVYFYPEGELKHTVKDNTSVVLDRKPDEKKIRVGLNVISTNTEKGKFELGRVKQIWEKNGGGKVVESGWEDAGKGPETTKYLVKTYLDGKEHWKSASSLRLLPKPNIDGIPLCFLSFIFNETFITRLNGKKSFL